MAAFHEDPIPSTQEQLAIRIGRPADWVAQQLEAFQIDPIDTFDGPELWGSDAYNAATQATCRFVLSGLEWAFHPPISALAIIAKDWLEVAVYFDRVPDLWQIRLWERHLIWNDVNPKARYSSSHKTLFDGLMALRTKLLPLAAVSQTEMD